MSILVAEIGWNFLGDISLAKKMILEAKKSGADGKISDLILNF